jgi:hypothetical protein
MRDPTAIVLTKMTKVVQKRSLLLFHSIARDIISVAKKLKLKFLES